MRERFGVVIKVTLTQSRVMAFNAPEPEQYTSIFMYTDSRIVLGSLTGLCILAIDFLWMHCHASRGLVRGHCSSFSHFTGAMEGLSEATEDWIKAVILWVRVWQARQSVAHWHPQKPWWLNFKRTYSIALITWGLASVCPLFALGVRIMCSLCIYAGSYMCIHSLEHIQYVCSRAC